MTKPRCCQPDCGKDATVMIHGASGHPEDYTEACFDHVGELLGTTQWLLPNENKSWTVTLIPDAAPEVPS